MELRLDQTEFQKDLSDIFLHFYFNSISQNSADSLVSSMMTKLSNVDQGPR